MIATVAEARDQIFTILRDSLDLLSFPEDQIIWDNAPTDQPSGNLSTVYAEVRHTLGRQDSLSGVTGVKKWLNRGILMVTLDTPRESGGLGRDTLLQNIQEAYEGVTTPGRVWFRNVRISEGAASLGNWRRSHVFADFEYNRIH